MQNTFYPTNQIIPQVSRRDLVSILNLVVSIIIGNMDSPCHCSGLLFLVFFSFSPYMPNSPRLSTLNSHSRRFFRAITLVNFEL